MTWRTAKSLDTLVEEVNARSPRRSKVSDGTIGDAAHASRDSDHNPWVKDGATGIVTARDITNDPAHGFDSSEFADWLRKRCKAGEEKRVKYVISDRRIASARESWAWRAYSGTNPHEHHVHVSVHPTKSLYDNERSWGWEAAGKPVKPAAPKPSAPTSQGDTVTDRLHPDDIKAIAEAVAQQTIYNEDPGVPGRKITTIGGALTDLDLQTEQARTELLGKLRELLDAFRGFAELVENRLPPTPGQ